MLHRVLKDMGFMYKVINNKRYLVHNTSLILTVRAYYEQPRIVHQRHSYLRRMRQNRTEGRPVVYLDETWCNAHDGKDKAWVEKDTTCRGGTLGGPAGFGYFG